MAIVDYTFYHDVFMGDSISNEEWAKYEARAEDIVCAMTHWRVSANTIAEFSEFDQTMVKKAICAQADAVMLNGMESLTGGVAEGFTVGKVSVHAKAGGAYRAGALASAIAPLALAYLEQTGLLRPDVPVIKDLPYTWGW